MSSAGKKSGSEKRKATETLGIRLTPEDKKTIEEKARTAGLTMGEFMRRASLSKQIESRDSSKLIAEVARLARELKRQGAVQLQMKKHDPAHAKHLDDMRMQIHSLIKIIGEFFQEVAAK